MLTKTPREAARTGIAGRMKSTAATKITINFPRVLIFQ